MRFVMFYHSLISCWNHGNAHFLRGVISDLRRRGHEVVVYEPRDGWSLDNLLRDHGDGPIEGFRRAYPGLESRTYDASALPGSLDLDEALAGADAVIVHEWSELELVRAIGAHRRAGGPYTLLFHDTHHRAVSDPGSIGRFDLSGYDGVLAFGAVLAAIYLERGWARRAFVWHEAADTERFKPLPRNGPPEADLVWVGNWGDDERTQELHEFLLEPVRALGISARVHGVRYPDEAKAALARAGIDYAGFVPNHEVPAVFARHRVTVHVPRRHYVQALPGIPTIRPFEALACGIPLVSAPWDDRERLFRAGRDYLVARDGDEMKAHLRQLLADPAYAQSIAASGMETVHARHSCSHRADELLSFLGAFERSHPRDHLDPNTEPFAA